MAWVFGMSKVGCINIGNIGEVVESWSDDKR